MGSTAKGAAGGLATLDTTGKVPAAQAALQGSAALDFPSIAAGAVATLSITVTGAAVGDRVAVAAPSTVNAGLMWCAHVSAADTVTIRLLNTTGGAIDPASATWKVSVFQ
ncbi:hypothetical protein GCM10009530_63780 [Microbispora corallina]|uniref:Uncharacterized protein n=1 Tax=Microbispora corallina TaxID=83302 RepID=A0ABQ4GC77_9ACTN|nr:hypothetical protein [Microbispora corallina]GIH44601.1 hypothetical protein Mco01_76010 [Microbispora corallina]